MSQRKGAASNEAVSQRILGTLIKTVKFPQALFFETQPKGRLVAAVVFATGAHYVVGSPTHF
jgi:hypothetical protein